MIRILLVDDQADVRRGLQMRLALEPEFLVVGEAQTGAEALTQVALLHPDLVIIDVVLSDQDGMKLIARLRTQEPACAIIVLSLQDDNQTRTRAAAVGAVAFVSKRESPELLTAALRRVIGQTYV